LWAIAIASLCADAAAWGASGDLIRTFVNPTPEATDKFGYRMVTLGNQIAITAPRDNPEAASSGIVYVYDVASGRLNLAIGDPTPVETGDGFGWALGTDGEHIIVGDAHHDDPVHDSGAVRWFNANTGELASTLLNPTPAADTVFGNILAASPDFVAVAAPYDSTAAYRSGIIHVFDARTHGLLHTIPNPTPGEEDHFGSELTIAGSDLMVGVWRDDVGAPDSGAVHVFDLATGTRRFTLPNPTPAQGDGFGIPTRIGNWIFVGAPADDTAGADAGAIYMFDATTGALLRTIPHPAPPRGAQFGYHLTPVGQYLAVSAPGKNLGGNDVGAVYFFDAATTDLVHIMNTRSGQDDLFIGDRLAAVGNDILVAAAFQDIDGLTDVGEVYLFEGPPPGLRTIARTDFSEARLGASSFVPGPGNQELGFSTVVDPDSLGVTPIAQVNHDGTINSPALIHQSLEATTTFDFVDLTGWQDVSVLVNLRVAINTFFEEGDLLRVVLQNGVPDAETVVLINLMGATGTDALDALRDDGYSYYMAHVPSHWSEVRLVVTTSSNSSLDAERFEFDGIRIVGVHAIPEPPTALLALFGLLGLAGFKPLLIARAGVDFR
jgi:outer membrane protein assembly factor BamB